jgi:SAM-dependent methyltransferase
VNLVAIDRKTHWENVYSARGEMGVSWYQREPRLALELIRSVAPPCGGRIIDVGGGASVLVDRLLDLPFQTIAVLDIAETALAHSRVRLGERAKRVKWITADITEADDLNLGNFDVWHDRAVFHFLTEAGDRTRYVELARKTVQEGGHIVIASFALDGPHQCSGLDVCRYNAEAMGAEFGEDFSLVREATEAHRTPSGSSQAFFYGVFRRR